MRKSTVISLIALLVSFVGLLIALIAYFKRRSCALCDDLDEDDEDGFCCGCDDCCGEELEAGEDEESDPEE